MTDHTLTICLHRPSRGVPRPVWVVGINPAGDPVRDSWDAATPHLAVTGRSGTGKSTMIDSMLCQLMHNNHPEDLTVWIAEPKNHLHVYRDVAHVGRFMDAMTGSDRHQAFAELLTDATKLMSERYKAMSEHPSKPKHFTETAAASSGETDRLPFGRLLIVVEECANYLSANGLRDSSAAAHADIVESIKRIARTGRAVGVHLAVVTQYPDDGLVPSSLLLQCRHIQTAPGARRSPHGPLYHPEPGAGLYGSQHGAQQSPYGRLELDQSQRDAVIALLPSRDTATAGAV